MEVNEVSLLNSFMCPFYSVETEACLKKRCTTYCDNWLRSLDYAPEFEIKNVDWDDEGYMTGYTLTYVKEM